MFCLSLCSPALCCRLTRVGVPAAAWQAVRTPTPASTTNVPHLPCISRACWVGNQHGSQRPGAPDAHGTARGHALVHAEGVPELLHGHRGCALDGVAWYCPRQRTRRAPGQSDDGTRCVPACDARAHIQGACVRWLVGWLVVATHSRFPSLLRTSPSSIASQCMVDPEQRALRLGYRWFPTCSTPAHLSRLPAHHNPAPQRATTAQQAGVRPRMRRHHEW